MLRPTSKFLRRTSPQALRGLKVAADSLAFQNSFAKHKQEWLPLVRYVSGSASSPSLSLWRRKKEMTKEGLIAAKDPKRLRSDPVRLDCFIRANVDRVLKSNLLAVLAKFQRQD